MRRTVERTATKDVTMNCKTGRAGWFSTRRRRGLALAGGAIILLLAAVSCQTVNRAVVELPDVPGAKYIGSKECDQCHDKLYRDFATADHARLVIAGPNALNAGCESCHGPCSLHSESGGETKPPYSFTAGRPQTSSFGARLQVEPGRAKETVCFQCHLDVQGQFNLPSHHPVPEGRLTCTTCHSPHKGSIIIGGGTSLLSENDNCFRCHAAVNAKLLTVRDANLCLKCHFQQISGGKLLIGGSDHTVRVQQGTCWTAGCHTAVHGSRVSPSLRF